MQEMTDSQGREGSLISSCCNSKDVNKEFVKLCQLMLQEEYTVQLIRSCNLVGFRESITPVMILKDTGAGKSLILDLGFSFNVDFSRKFS